jgi:hypothetical protein
MKFLDWLVGAIIWKEMADTLFDHKSEPKVEDTFSLTHDDDWSDDVYD